MNIVIAVDSFKGSLSSLEAGASVREGILKAMPDAKVTVRPLADGGEGTVEALTLGMQGHMERAVVSDPLGRPIEAAYGILDNTKTGIIEISAAAGITLVTEQERNPLNTTTYGVGQMIRDAIGRGCRNFIVGIGGSATNDGGVGMLQALGYGFWDRDGLPVPPGAGGLRELVSITDDNVLPELSECRFKIACDVTNPLCGENGASAVYGPQKGATPEMVHQMDKWLNDYALLAAESFPKADKLQAGTGAAGGLGFAFLTFTNAVLESGVGMILEETALESYIREADLVITGEGRLDRQTAMGKAPGGVAALAKKHGKKVLAFSGCVTEDAVICNEHGIDAFFPIMRNAATLSEACDPENARKNMTSAVEQVFRLIQCYL